MSVSINWNCKLFVFELLKLFFIVTVYYWVIEIKYHITRTFCLGKCTSAATLVWKYEDIRQYKFITSWTVCLMKLLKHTCSLCDKFILCYKHWTDKWKYFFWGDVFTILFATCAEGAIQDILYRFQTNSISLSDCNETRTYNHLVCKRTLNHLA